MKTGRCLCRGWFQEILAPHGLAATISARTGSHGFSDTSLLTLLTRFLRHNCNHPSTTFAGRWRCFGRDSIRMNAARSWTMRSVRVNQASAQRGQPTCSQPTWSPPRNRQLYNLTNTRSGSTFSLRFVASARDYGPCIVLQGGHAACFPCRTCRKADRQRRPGRLTIWTDARSSAGGL
jgi:hypothetical protein